MSPLDKLLSEDVSDETAVAISNLLIEMFCLWESWHAGQIRRYHELNAPPVADPQRPWERSQPLSDEELAKFNDELPF